MAGFQTNEFDQGKWHFTQQVYHYNHVETRIEDKDHNGKQFIRMGGEFFGFKFNSVQAKHFAEHSAEYNREFAEKQKANPNGLSSKERIELLKKYYGVTGPIEQGIDKHWHTPHKA